VCTDSAQALTHGSPIGPLAFLSRLNPAVGIYTCILPSSEGSTPLIGQMQYAAGDRSARISFLMPDNALSQPGVTGLTENLAVQAGSWGAFHLLAEVEENSCAMEGLRRSGFSVYAWQHIWKYTPPGSRSANKHPANGKKASQEEGLPADKIVLGVDQQLAECEPAGNNKHSKSLWHPATSVDEVMIRSLYQSLVPPLVQSAEPLTSRRLLGWVYRQEGEILAYVEGIYGPQGIYLQPLIHPAVEDISLVLTNLIAHQRNPLGRPVYIAIRSYQAWLTNLVRDLKGEVGPRQALMVKHLVVQQRAAVAVLRHSVLEKYTAEPAAPLVPNSTAIND
jgi:hypothetical protein